jgi:HK97 family phage portal protein
MGLWPRSARASVDAVARDLAPVTATETWPTSAVVYDMTTGARVAVSGITDTAVSRGLALSVPAVLRGVSLLATTVAGLPMSREDGDGKRVPLGWLEQPEPGRSRFATFTSVGYDLILDGMAYLRVNARDASGAPAMGGCEYVDLTRVGTMTATNGAPVLLIDGQQVDPRDVIGFEGWHDGIRNHGARIIRTALALEAAARRYADTPMPSQVLVNTSGYDLTDEEIDALLADYKGARNQEGVGYVNAGIKPETVGWDAAQLQLVEARQYTSTQLANLIGIPAHAIAGAASMGSGTLTYQNVLQENRSLQDYGVRTLARAIESRLSLSDAWGRAGTVQVTPRGHTVRIDLDAMLRGSPMERAQVYEVLIRSGVMTVDEARAREELAPQGRTNA